MVVDVIRLIDTNKAKLAFLVPFILTVCGVIATWAITGEFNVQEIRTGVAGLVTSIGAAIAAYLGKPGQAVVQTVPDTEVEVDPQNIDH